ncbi:CALM-like protein [Mya arenaria]|uniref:CALM-like protein n=1 Tax=Mya arenaria TaxID=6604 RepID=A0ABY7F8I2_MYAAR|nr:CALM-like protein [Mya arenaria]
MAILVAVSSPACNKKPKQEDGETTMDKENGRIEFQEFFKFMQAEMTKLNEADFTNNQDTVRSAFRTFDKDGNGYIDEKELRIAMKKLGEALTDKELDDMMKEADVDEDGKINYEGIGVKVLCYVIVMKFDFKEFVKIWCETT